MQMTPQESEFLRDLVLRDSAIVLGSDKEYLLATRLTPVLRLHQLDSVTELVTRLRREPNGPLRAAVVEAMTTNETSFFRDTHPWETLREDLIPRLIEAKRSTRELTFACAACSSGQEPYSLAMLLTEYFPDIVATWRIRILGTDLSASMVERTKAGSFSQLEVGRGLPSALLPRYFSRAGMTWQARDDLRSMIDARVANLSERAAWTQLPALDGIFLRNVLIYFAAPTKETILGWAHERLRPTGFMLLGASETMVGLNHPFTREQVQKTTYFRSAAAPPLPEPARSLVTTTGAFR